MRSLSMMLSFAEDKPTPASGFRHVNVNDERRADATTPDRRHGSSMEIGRAAAAGCARQGEQAQEHRIALGTVCGSHQGHTGRQLRRITS